MVFEEDGGVVYGFRKVQGLIKGRVVLCGVVGLVVLVEVQQQFVVDWEGLVAQDEVVCDFVVFECVVGIYVDFVFDYFVVVGGVYVVFVGIVQVDVVFEVCVEYGFFFFVYGEDVVIIVDDYCDFVFFFVYYWV